MTFLLYGVVAVSLSNVGLALLVAFMRNVWPPEGERYGIAGFVRTSVGNVLFVTVAGVTAYVVATLPAAMLPLAVAITLPAGVSAGAYLLRV